MHHCLITLALCHPAHRPPQAGPAHLEHLEVPPVLEVPDTLAPPPKVDWERLCAAAALTMAARQLAARLDDLEGLAADVRTLWAVIERESERIYDTDARDVYEEGEVLAGELWVEHVDPLVIRLHPMLAALQCPSAPDAELAEWFLAGEVPEWVAAARAERQAERQEHHRP